LKSILNVAVLLFVGLSASRQPVRAQEVDVYIGLGTAHASSNGQQIDAYAPEQWPCPSVCEGEQQ
jgi:hypothetical protein